ncbi:DUF4260 family protein [Catenulispora yoronensis]|uniref:DUF4260 family protein n=1 Tax=Catenulispora yoronensis TaxID=450799 RepID=A0ABN2U4C6_9ACTN
MSSITTTTTFTGTTAGTTTGHRLPSALRRTVWAAWAVFLAAFAILEGVNHGGGSWLALTVGMIAPDLSFFAAAGAHEPVRQGQLPRKAVPFYNTAHRTWIPFGLAVAYTLLPLTSPMLFTFLLAWMLHIAVDRVAGYNLRTKEGFVRG